MRGVLAFTALFGALMVLAPAPTDQFFTTLMGPKMPTLTPDAHRYVLFCYSVMGALIVGWMTALEGTRRGWPAQTSIAASVAIWWATDCSAALAWGYWPNAVLNTAMAGLFLAAWLYEGRPRDVNISPGSP